MYRKPGTECSLINTIPTPKHDGGASYCGDALLQQRLRSTETPESGSPIQPCWKFSKIMVCQPCANLSTLRILMLKAYFNLLFFNLYTHTHTHKHFYCLFKVLQLHLYFLNELNLLRHFYTYQYAEKLKASANFPNTVFLKHIMTQ